MAEGSSPQQAENTPAQLPINKIYKATINFFIIYSSVTNNTLMELYKRLEDLSEFRPQSRMKIAIPVCLLVVDFLFLFLMVFYYIFVEKTNICLASFDSKEPVSSENGYTNVTK